MLLGSVALLAGHGEGRGREPELKQSNLIAMALLDIQATVLAVEKR